LCDRSLEGDITAEILVLEDDDDNDNNNNNNNTIPSDRT
jgi:hypothetical protein